MRCDMPFKLFELCRTKAPWGDYGNMLVHGMTGYLGRDSRRRLQLQRTGPFVPPITMPGVGVVVVCDRVRERLGSSGLTGLQFRADILKQVVELDWEGWDRTACLPRRLPPGGEPENYFLRGRHRPELAKGIGPLWEVYSDKTVELVEDGTETLCGMEFPRMLPDRDTWPVQDFCSAGRGSQLLVTGKARRVVERLSGGTVTGVERPWASRS